jgi:hypothetical protein
VPLPVIPFAQKYRSANEPHGVSRGSCASPATKDRGECPAADLYSSVPARTYEVDRALARASLHWFASLVQSIKNAVRMDEVRHGGHATLVLRIGGQLGARSS